MSDPDLAERASGGELVTLPWRGGTANLNEPDPEKPKGSKKYGTLQYLATWQGLRGEDLNILFDEEIRIECSKTARSVTFRQEKRSSDSIF